MATIGDVESAIATLIGAAIYPTGPSVSVLGHPVKIYAGWPNPQTLDVDLVETAGKPAAAHIAIFAAGAAKASTRYLTGREEFAIQAATYTLAANGQQVTVGGAPPATYFAQNLAVGVNGRKAVVQATAGQTPAQVAAALQTALSAIIGGVTVSGAVITLPTAARLTSLVVGTTGSAVRAVANLTRHVQVGIYTSSPSSREAIARLIGPVLADARRLSLPDGSFALVATAGEREDDFIQKQRIYRRVRLLGVDYAETITETAAQLVAGEIATFDVFGRPIATNYS